VHRLLAILAAAAIALAADKQTALDRYIATTDPSYKYELVQTRPGEGFTAYVLDMTSQSWRSPAGVNRTYWRHWDTIIKPNQIKHSTAFLHITGGANNDVKPPARAPANLTSLAVDTGTVVAELRMAPNQPLILPVIFAGETKGRTETH
jgi:PhoPQ-activated pathogenicity-related protein